MLEAEEVEPLGAPGELHDPGLLGRKPQPQLGQDRRHQLAGRLGLPAGGAEDDQVICVADQHSQPPPVGLTGLIEDMQGDVCEQR